MIADPHDLVIAAALDRERWGQDPIERHQFSSPQARELVVQVGQEIETLLCGGNRSGKSKVGSLLGTCLSRGVDQIDGRTVHEHRDQAPPYLIDLPRVRTPNIGILLVRSYKLAEHSVVRDYKRWIGAHPHRYLKEGKYTTELRVRPDNSAVEDDEQWSRILVFPAGGIWPEGLEAQWAQADEPPDWPFWEEIRSRRGQFPLYRWLTVTPLRRSEWEPMKADFDRPADWKLELNVSMRDNQWLSPTTIKKLEATWEHDPLKDARLSGAYVDLSMSSPFRTIYPLLRAGLERCRDPLREERVQVMAEMDDGKRMDIQPAWGTVYIFEDAVPGERYFIPGDPSLGVDDEDHDPCGAHVYTEGLKGPVRMVARYNGYLGSYGLGWLMASLGERYNDALLDPFMTGGHGGPMMIAFRNYRSSKYPSGYTHISHDKAHERDGKWQQPYGHTESAVVNAEKLECLRWAILERALDIPSAATWRCFLDAVLDKHGRLSKEGGARYEDLDLAGRAAYRHFAREKPWAKPTPEQHVAAIAYRQEFGRRVRVGREPRRSVFSSQPWARS